MADLMLQAAWNNPEQARSHFTGTMAPWCKSMWAAGHRLVVEVRLHEDVKTDKQRKFYHGVVLKTIAQQARPNGQQHPLAAWEPICRYRCKHGARPMAATRRSGLCWLGIKASTTRSLRTVGIRAPGQRVKATRPQTKPYKTRQTKPCGAARIAYRLKKRLICFPQWTPHEKVQKLQAAI